MGQDRKVVHTEHTKEDDWLFDLVAGKDVVTVTSSDGKQGVGKGGSVGEATAAAVKDLNGK